jgi:hypothetical protein
MDREEQIFEDLDGAVDAPADTEVELEEIKDDDFEVEVSSESGEEHEQPEEEPETEIDIPSPKVKEDQEESEEDDLSSYSKKVRKRIERERRISRAAKAEAETLRQQLDALRAEKEVVASTEQIDAALAEKRAKLKAIREEFDPDKVDEEINLFSEIADLQAQKQQLGARGTPQSAPAQASKPNPHAAKWLERNQGWFDAPGYSAQSAVARQIDQSLIAEGYSPSDAGYFEELDRRLSKTVRLPTHTRSKAAVSPVAPVTEGVTHSKTKVVLTKQDLAFMAKMGMDPKNPAHLKAFAAERRTSLRSS